MSTCEFRVSIEYRQSVGNAYRALSYFPGAQRVPGAWDWRMTRGIGPYLPGVGIIALVTIEQSPSGRHYLRNIDRLAPAATFVPVDTTNGEESMFAAHVGRVMAASMTIHRLSDEQPDEGVRLEVEPAMRLAMLPQNLTDSELAKLQPGSQMIVEGVARDSRKVQEFCVLTLETSSGHREIGVRLSPFNQPVYRGFDQSRIAAEPVLPGETLRLTATVTDNFIPVAEQSSLIRLAPPDDYSPKYKRLRSNVAQRLCNLRDYVRAGKYSHARALFAQLRYLMITQDEALRALELIRRLPLDQRPIYREDPLTHYEFRKYFGVSLERFNKAEFREFALERLQAMPTGPEMASHACLLDYLTSAPYVADEIAQTLHDSLGRYFELLSVDASFGLLLDTVVQHVGTSGHDLLAADVIGLIEQCIKRGYFPREGISANEAACPGWLSRLLVDLVRVAQRWVDDSKPAAAHVTLARVDAWQQRLANKSASPEVLSSLMDLRLPLESRPE